MKMSPTIAATEDLKVKRWLKVIRLHLLVVSGLTRLGKELSISTLTGLIVFAVQYHLFYHTVDSAESGGKQFEARLDSPTDTQVDTTPTGTLNVPRRIAIDRQVTENETPMTPVMYRAASHASAIKAPWWATTAPPPISRPTFAPKRYVAVAPNERERPVRIHAASAAQDAALMPKDLHFVTNELRSPRVRPLHESAWVSPSSLPKAVAPSGSDLFADRLLKEPEGVLAPFRPLHFGMRAAANVVDFVTDTNVSLISGPAGAVASIIK